MQKFKGATLNEIIAEDSESIYVINNTANGRRTQSGVIFLTISTNEGDRPVYVPKTWVPFDLTSQIQKSQLVASSDFRTAIRNKTMLLISTVEAVDFLENEPNAAVEFDRANQDLLNNNNFELDADTEISNTKAISMRRNTIKNANPKLQKMEANVEDEVEDALPKNVDLKVQEILMDNSYSDSERYTLLKNAHLNDAFSEDDCEYILENCNDEKIKSFVVNVMNKM